jgi:phage protein D
VTRIAREHGLTAQAPAGTTEHILQSNVSDAVFLRRMAHKQGHHLRIEGKKLIVGPPPSGAVVRVSLEDGLREVKIRINASEQVGEVSVHGWDPKTKQEIVATAKPQGPAQQGAKDHGAGSTLSISGHGHAPVDAATAEAMAKGRLRTIAERFVTAHVEMIGNPSVMPGAQVDLEKLGAGVDGRYRVVRALHKFSKHGYYVTFEAVRTAQKKPAKSPPAAQTQPSNTTWLELELLDSAGQPVPYERYKVVTADGKEIEGVLDAEGRARLTGIPLGSNNVSFPDYEPEWHRA